MNLLKKGGIEEEPLTVTQLSGGANNRVYRLEFETRKPLICKHYFQHAGDKRPRLQAEYAFLSYAWENGLRQIPEPLASDEKNHQALYSFVPGKSPKEVTEKMVDQALSFFLSLNQNKNEAQNIPFASESCLTAQDYFSTVEQKLTQCQAISDTHPFHHDVKSFIQNQLIPRWEQTYREVTLDPHQKVAKEDLCITPSDFGFHNALIDGDKVSFLDFEYAGWDDPTKTVCDFFCQPKLPVPLKFFEKVATTIASTTQTPELYLKRIQAVLPICQIKWCCIMLNVFQKIGSERRRFSNPNFLEKYETQLTLAKRYLERL
ncbi:MAG: aminoglycoside phosphotransferase family protein [Simkaniaceae bacterium]|nr:aminoglycoside phosphotransferase family protein [Simkaniaceae bacterium]